MEVAGGQCSLTVERYLDALQMPEVPVGLELVLSHETQVALNAARTPEEAEVHHFDHQPMSHRRCEGGFSNQMIWLEVVLWQQLHGSVYL